MAYFNPFLNSSSSGGGGGGSSDTVRYTVVKQIDSEGKTFYKLRQTINSTSSTVGEDIKFTAGDVSYNNTKLPTITNVSDAIDFLANQEAVTYTAGTGIKISNDNVISADTEGIKSIDTVTFASSTMGTTAGIAGATDTYTITYTDKTTSTFTVQNGESGKEVELQVSSGRMLQWKYTNEAEWKDLLNLDILKGADGIDGKNGEKGEAGKDGREIEISTTSTNIQWRYNGEDTWNELVSLESLKGKDGKNGINGQEVELQTTDTTIQWKYKDETIWKDLVSLSSLKGMDGTNGKEIELQSDGTNIQWHYAGDTNWNNLIAVELLKGVDGKNGTNGTNGKDGADGKEIELRTNEDAIQWRYTGDTAWNDLVSLTRITGEDGIDGKEIELRVSGNYIQWKYKTDTNWTNLISTAALKGADGISVTNATIQSDKHLWITLSNGNTIDCGEAKGTDGTSINIKGSLTSENDLPSTDNEKGDCYIIDGDLYVYTDSVTGPNGFENVGSIKGPAGTNGKEVEISVSDSNVLRWRYVGSTAWTNLFDLSLLEGEDGTNGKEVEMRATSTYIQWKYTSESAWKNLIAISVLEGKDGINGLGVTTAEINNENHLIMTMSDGSTIDCGLVRRDSETEIADSDYISDNLLIKRYPVLIQEANVGVRGRKYGKVCEEYVDVILGEDITDTIQIGQITEETRYPLRNVYFVCVASDRNGLDDIETNTILGYITRSGEIYISPSDGTSLKEQCTLHGSVHYLSSTSYGEDIKAALSELTTP